MSRKRLYDWGEPYLLTDLKEGVFQKEPAVCVGKHNSDMMRPTICAVCGEPLGSKGYYSFFLLGPNGNGKDMMIGRGCLKDRIKSEKIDILHDRNPRNTLDKIVTKFPTSGRWYGTFLHHCIAKPYVRNEKVAENWDESILRLPGVRYIMEIIDKLRNEGWELDAEMLLENGRVDLLATHPEKGAIVYDWKTDQSFDSHDAYVAQVNGYLSELYKAGMQKIMGYIVWILSKQLEPVLLKDTPLIEGKYKPVQYVPSPVMACSLTVDMDGGEGIDRKKWREESHRRLYGDEVFFFIPPCDPYKQGYEFSHFEASPYREGEHAQAFNWSDLEDGLRLRFICSKKRRSFFLKAYWAKKRPFTCTLNVTQVKATPRVFTITSQSKMEDGVDFAEFDVSKISEKLHGESLIRATLIESGSFRNSKTEWGPEDLQKGMTIQIPCLDECTRFGIIIETTPNPKTTPRINKKVKRTLDEKRSTTPAEPIIVPGSWEAFYKSLKDNPLPPPAVKEEPQRQSNEIVFPDEESFQPVTIQEKDLAHTTFMPGRIYKSGRNYYGIYKRKNSQKTGTYGMVDVAEVDIDGRIISDLVGRYVYKTKGGKEYIHGISDHNWKIYTQYVLVGISPEGMERFRGA